MRYLKIIEPKLQYPSLPWVSINGAFELLLSLLTINRFDTSLALEILQFGCLRSLREAACIVGEECPRRIMKTSMSVVFGVDLLEMGRQLPRSVSLECHRTNIVTAFELTCVCQLRFGSTTPLRPVYLQVLALLVSSFLSRSLP